MTYRVEVTEPAEVDIREQMRYLRGRFSPAAAEKWLAGLNKAIAPFIALFLALVPALLLSLGSRRLGLEEEATKSVFPILLIPSCLGTLAWGIREYRGRASTEVAIYRDGLVARIGGVHRGLGFAEVLAVRLDPAGMDLACTLETATGRPIRLPPDVAPCSVARGALEASVIRTLARRVADQIDAHGSVEVIESGTRSTFVIARGMMLMTGGILLTLNSRIKRPVY